MKFRRQHPLGWYIADFYCPSAMLVIEIDGDSHASQAEYDDERTAWLESQGIRVIRFSNQEITGNIDFVLEKIVEMCRRAE
jgi:very-short-patch-repair endonuclease